MAASTVSDGSSMGPPSPSSTTSPLASFALISVVASPLMVAWNGSPLPSSSTEPSTATRSPGFGLMPLACSASLSVLLPPTSMLDPFNVMEAGRLCTTKYAPTPKATSTSRLATMPRTRRPVRFGCACTRR